MEFTKITNIIINHLLMISVSFYVSFVNFKMIITIKYSMKQY